MSNEIGVIAAWAIGCSAGAVRSIEVLSSMSRKIDGRWSPADEASLLKTTIACAEEMGSVGSVRR